MHKTAAWHSYTHSTYLRLWGSGSHVTSKWCHLVIVETDWHLKLNFQIHIRHIQSVAPHWYDVHIHSVAALYSYTHPTWLRFWGFGSHVESKWCHHIIVEADRHLKLLPPSILDIYKMFEHIDMLFPYAYSSSSTQLFTILISDCGVLIRSLIKDWVKLDLIDILVLNQRTTG